jgi:glycine/D-amino acid oxidase-like deaminating enzyme
MTRQLVLRGDIVAVDRSIWLITEMEREHGERYLRRTGVLTINPRSRVLKRLEIIYRSLGISYRILDPYDIRSRWEIVSVEDNEIGIYTEDDGILDIGSLVYRIRREIVEAGGHILENCGETLLETLDGRRVVRAYSDNSMCNIYGDVFLLNIGVNTSRVYRKSFGKPLKPGQLFFRCQSMLTDLGGEYDMPVIYDNRSHLYIAPESIRRAIVGDGPCEILGSEDSQGPSYDILYKVIEDLSLRVKNHERITPLKIVSHLCDATLDLIPFVGRDKILKNLYLAYGLSSYGIMRSPYLGVQIARMITGRNTDPIVSILGPRDDPEQGFCEETHTPIM